jgi:hypothetical protein
MRYPSAANHSVVDVYRGVQPAIDNVNEVKKYLGDEEYFKNLREFQLHAEQVWSTAILPALLSTCLSLLAGA